MGTLKKFMAHADMVKISCVDTTDVVENARKIHKLNPTPTAALGRLLTMGLLMGTMSKGEKDKLTLQIIGDGPLGSILVVADVKGNVKGYVTNPNVEVENYPNGKLNVAGAVGNQGHVKVIKDIGLREPYNGSYPIVSGEIAEDFTHYFALSEQTPSVVSLGVLTRSDEVEFAGGFIVQLMPDAQEENIVILEKNISNLPSITNLLKDGKTPEDILNIVLDGLNPRILDKCEVKFECECSKEKVKEALVAIGKIALGEIIEEDKKAEVGCQFCNRKYNYTESELIEVLENM